MTWDPVSIGKLAGLVEGEGSIVIRDVANNSGRGKKKYPLAVLAISMTDEDVVRWLQTFSGLGRIHGPIIDKRGPNRKPCWTWTVAKQRDLARLLLAIAPLMHERRRAKIMEAADVLAPGAPAKAIQHGTLKGYHQERRRGLKTCGRCRAANAAAHAEYLKGVESDQSKPTEAPVG